MKNFVKTFAIAAALFATAFTANAEEKENRKGSFDTGVYTTKTGKINVMVDKTSNESATTITLRNVKGETFYRETIDKNMMKFGRSLNVAELSAGQYELKVSSNGEVKTKSFEVSQEIQQRTLTIK